MSNRVCRGSKLLNAVFLTAFLLFAAVQYNDPDSRLWIAVYGLAAAMCILYHLNKPAARPLARVMLAVGLGWSALLLPAVLGQVSWQELFESISMKTQSVEEAREMGGLMTIAAWAAWVGFRPSAENR